MEKYVPDFEEHAILEKLKKKKSEREYIDIKKREFDEKIKKKKEQIDEIDKGDDSAKRKALRIKIKKNEIQMLEYELNIVRLRYENTQVKDEMKSLDDK